MILQAIYRDIDAENRRRTGNRDRLMRTIDRSRFAFPAVLVLASVLVASQALGDVVDECSRSRDIETRIRGCTVVISGGGFSAEQKAIAFRNRGRTRVEAGALEAAIADLDEAVKLGPADSQSYVYRALARTGRGNVDGAIADYGEVIRLTPTSAIGYNGRGHAYLVKRNAVAAIADFTTAIRLNPVSPSAYNNRGLAHRMAGDASRAIDDFTQAILLNPIYALAYNNRGYAHEAGGRKADAIDDYRYALMLDPSLTGAKDGLVRLGASGFTVAESARLVLDGRAVVQAHCSACHAIGRTGASPNSKAPPFHSLHARHPMQSLREPLTRGIAAPHDEMPRFELPVGEIDKIVAYINSLGAAN